MGSGVRSRLKLKVLLAAASVLGTLLCLELGIRVCDALRGKSWNHRASWYWLAEQDPYLGYRGRPDVEIRFESGGTYRHNRDGYRDDRTLADIAAIPGHRLVICVGESSTYGIGAPTAAQAYPARLEAHLREASGDPSWHVFNAGFPAYSSHQIVELLHLRLLKYAPEAVVLMNLRNDVELVARIVDDTTDLGDIPLRLAPIPATCWNDLVMRSSLVGLVATRLRTAREDAASNERAPTVTPRGKAFYLDNLATAALLCRRAGTRLLAVDQPIFDDAYSESHRRTTQEMRDAMRATCRELEVPVLDANRPMHESGFRSPDDVHLGPAGYDQLAALLAPQILAAFGGAKGR